MTPISSPSMEMGAQTWRCSQSPKCDDASRPKVGESAFAMYCRMMSRGLKPRTSIAPWLRIIGPSQSSARSANAEAQEQPSWPSPK